MILACCVLAAAIFGGDHMAVRSGRVLADGLNLRSEPRVTGLIYDVLTKGDRFEVTNQVHRSGEVIVWLNVRVVRTNKVGWIARWNAKDTFVELDPYFVGQPPPGAGTAGVPVKHPPPPPPVEPIPPYVAKKPIDHPPIWPIVAIALGMALVLYALVVNQ
jgi:Bacterial SH3 domain